MLWIRAWCCNHWSAVHYSEKSRCDDICHITHPWQKSGVWCLNHWNAMCDSEQCSVIPGVMYDKAETLVRGKVSE